MVFHQRQSYAKRRNLIQPLTIDEALQKLSQLISPPGANRTERMPVSEALGRVVAADTPSPIAVPAFENSAMDGYAVRHADLATTGPTELRVQGESLAGHPYPGPLNAASAIRIFTGAALPEGADTIVIQEDTTSTETTPEASASVTINETPARGAYTRPRGHDVDEGSLLLSAGTRIRAFEIAAATTSGLTHVDVFTPLRIGVFATGDELRTPGETLHHGQIYESNRIAIISLLAGLPLTITNLGILPDDPEATQAALAAASLDQDALITSGGVSVGDADYVREAIEELGGVDFWRLNLRPGKPFAFGHLQRANTAGADATDRCLIFGLPGNPVSTIVTLLLLVKPALWHMAGAISEPRQRLRAPLAQEVRHSVGRNEYQRGRLVSGAEGSLVTTRSDQSSNRLQSFAGANCLFLLPGEIEQFAAGDLVEVLPLEGL